eukprot:2405020-Amphidinium_carterae.1
MAWLQTFKFGTIATVRAALADELPHYRPTRQHLKMYPNACWRQVPPQRATLCAHASVLAQQLPLVFTLGWGFSHVRASKLGVARTPDARTKMHMPHGYG